MKALLFVILAALTSQHALAEYDSPPIRMESEPFTDDSNIDCRYGCAHVNTPFLTAYSLVYKNSIDGPLFISDGTYDGDRAAKAACQATYDEACSR